MRVLESMIGLLAPPECLLCGLEGRALCFVCSETEIIPYGGKCWHCGTLSTAGRACVNARKTGSPSSIWVVTDYENTAKKLVRNYKFNQQRSLALSIADTMIRTLLEYNSDKNLADKNYLLMPLPTATGRIRQRGFDHTQLLAKEINYRLKMPTSHHLRRIGQSRQVGAKKTERLAQIETSFYVQNPEKIKNRNILLIDDVITTGATICSANKALKTAGVKSVDALVFAKKL